LSQPAKEGRKGARPVPDSETFPTDLWDIDTVCRYFGGTRPLHVSTLYRGIREEKIYPPPRKVGGNTARWIPSECREYRDRLLADVDAHQRDGAAIRGRLLNRKSAA
jgi:predicted DNA-binding transcriptional regulator AlpA